MTELRICHTAELRSAELASVRRLLNEAYGARFTDEDWTILSAAGTRSRSSTASRSGM